VVDTQQLDLQLLNYKHKVGLSEKYAPSVSPAGNRLPSLKVSIVTIDALPSFKLRDKQMISAFELATIAPLWSAY
jgi:hypothetical protein